MVNLNNTPIGPTATNTPTATPTNTPTATPTPTTSGFPSTSVLDNFNRSNGALGSNWAGNTSNYSIVSNQVDVGSTEGDVYWSGTTFGADQEVFVTLTTVDASASEQDLLLKSQSSSDYLSGVIEVLYEAANHRVQVWTYTGAQSWVQHGADIAVTFANGDQFGARARPNGNVDVYRNGVLLGTRDVTAWPYYASTGYIGIWFINAGNAVLDNFGGGTSLSAWVPAKHGLAAPVRPAVGAAPLWSWLGERWAQLESLLLTPRRSTLMTPPVGQVWKSYYFAGSQRVAMRVEGDAVPANNGVFWLHTDHLGSTALATDGNGTVVANSRQLYDAWGNLRVTGTGLLTTVGFTGQRLDAATGGLMFYGARFYAPYLNRWLSPDTIVPDPQNPQTLNRYSYVNNRPLNFTDPTGHIDQNQVSDAEDILKELGLYGVEIVVDWGWSVSSKNIWSWNKGLWDLGELNTVLSGVKSLAKAMGGEGNFRNNLGGVKVEQKNLPVGGYGQAHYVELDDAGLDEWRVVHEFAHAWDANTGWKLSEQIETFTGGKTVGKDCILWFCRSSRYDFGGTPAKGADANFTRQEDLAESVAAFVYPTEAKQFVKTFYPNVPRYQYDNYYALPRAQFVAKQLGVNLGDFTTRHQ